MRKIPLWFAVTLAVHAYAHPGPGTRDDGPDRCLQCHGNQPAREWGAPTPPLLAEGFSMRWKMFELAPDARPPLGSPSGTFLRGETAYDWPSRRMTEWYPEKCIAIFPQGRDYPCRFTSLGDVTYLVRFRPGTAGEPESCCRWSASAFWAPRPDVLRNLHYDRALALNGRPTWWWLLDIPLPGPFGYGLDAQAVPRAFWFPVLSGWVQQDFEAYREGTPDPAAFALPPICRADGPVCDGT